MKALLQACNDFLVEFVEMEKIHVRYWRLKRCYAGCPMVVKLTGFAFFQLVGFFAVLPYIYPHPVSLSGGLTLYFEGMRSWGFYSDEEFIDFSKGSCVIESTTYGPFTISYKK